MQQLPPQREDTVVTLKRVLADTGWTQEEFAARARVSYGTVNRWLNGRAALSHRRLSNALVLAGVDVLSLAPGQQITYQNEPDTDPAEPAWATDLRAALTHQHDQLRKQLDEIALAISMIANRV